MELQEAQGKAEAALAKVSAHIFPRPSLSSACKKKKKKTKKIQTKRHRGIEEP